MANSRQCITDALSSDYGPILLSNSGVMAITENKVKIYSSNNGALISTLTFSDTLNGEVKFTDYAFDDSGHVVLSARLFKGLDDDMYFTKINVNWTPVSFNCDNPPKIQTISGDIIGANKSINLGAEAEEHLKYSDIIAYNWYFQDGGQEFGQYINYDFDETQYPDSFWCMLVVTDGITCSDTLTIEAYSGDIIFPNPIWPPENPNSLEEKANNSLSIVKPVIYPNPFNNEITIELSSIREKNERNNLAINIYDILGKKLEIPQQVRNDRFIIDGSILQKGIYIVEIKTSDFIYTEKVVKE